MKTARQFGPLPHVRYRPELTGCPHCGAALRWSHPVWAKPIQFLSGPEHVTNLGFRCENPGCAYPRSVYRSARAEARQVRGHGYGLDVLVRIGHLRFTEHRTREEIWRHLYAGQGIAITERHVQHLLEVYLALLRASGEDLAARLGPVAREHGGLILALDGLQPEQGNEQLWVVREVSSGAVVAAANLQQASAPFLVPLLRPVQQTGLRVLGVVSDAQESIRLAVAEVFPGVPHQLCQYHALREATEPLWEADRHLLVQVKKELRALRDVEERTRVRAAERQAAGQPPDPVAGVVLDTVLALRQVVRERGTQPLDFGALRALDQLTALGDTLDRSLAKKGIPTSPACTSS
jgi:Transposase, Mutator family